MGLMGGMGVCYSRGSDGDKLHCREDYCIVSTGVGLCKWTLLKGGGRIAHHT